MGLTATVGLRFTKASSIGSYGSYFTILRCLHTLRALAPFLPADGDLQFVAPRVLHHRYQGHLSMCLAKP